MQFIDKIWDYYIENNYNENEVNKLRELILTKRLEYQADKMPKTYMMYQVDEVCIITKAKDLYRVTKMIDKRNPKSVNTHHKNRKGAIAYMIC